MTQRITTMMAEIVCEVAQRGILNSDSFSYEVGVGPMPTFDEEEGMQYDMQAWTILRLDEEESNTCSTICLATPLEILSEENFRSAIEKAVVEIEFSRLASSIMDEEELMEVELIIYEDED